MNQTVKKYLISSLVTFLGGAALVLVTQIDNITLESFRDGSVVGTLFIVVRAGVKALVEWFIRTFVTKVD